FHELVGMGVLGVRNSKSRLSRREVSRLKVEKAAFAVALLLGELVMLFNLAKAMFVARKAEGVESGFFDENAARIGHDAGGAEMVLVVVTDALLGRGHSKVSRFVRMNVDRVARCQCGR